MTVPELFLRGSLADVGGERLGALLERAEEPSGEVAQTVANILADVRARGDQALSDLSARFDGVRPERLEVPRSAWDAARSSLDAAVRTALERAARNIRAYHASQLPSEVVVETEPDVRVTQTWVPLHTVGVYAPGGTAAYPSSVLMGVAPAKAAGVREVVVCSPPGPDGTPPPSVMAACSIARADRLFAVGGAGAIAAMAFGTLSVPRVDAIVGPGNRWVTEAKRQVAGRVPIDAPAGPSEVLVVADESADPELVAAELLAQAEHDPDAASVLVTDSPTLARAVEEALARQLAGTPRADIARRALAARGAILTAGSVAECLRFAERYAPEHLSLMTRGAAGEARRVSTAGTVFVGGSASVCFGDYMSGANHVLPTGGRSRSFSGLSVHHFLRSYTIQEIGASGAAALADDVHTLARAEGLPAHAAAALARRSS